MCARSAWKPTVPGMSTVSSTESIAFHECMPAQQTSPSAARRSPWPAATMPASRNVAAICLIAPFSSFAAALVPVALSMRMTPYLRTPCSLRMRAMRQALRTASMNFARCSTEPIALSPTVPGHTGATSEPTARFFAAILSAILRMSESLASGSRCEWKRKRSTPSNFWPSTFAFAVSSSMRSSEMGGWSVPGSLPTSPGHMALCSFIAFSGVPGTNLAPTRLVPRTVQEAARACMSRSRG